MTGLNHAFWKGKRVFITGHTGFKGVWLALWLQSLGADVFGYSTESRKTLRPNKTVAVPMESFQGDIVDRNALEAAMRACGPEIVFHLAAQPLVRRAFQDPIGTYRTNILGTANLFESARRLGSVRAIVVVTTDKCYEMKSSDWRWGYRERDPLGGNDPYSSSKACMEMVVQSFRDSFFPPERTGIATARAGNVIGGGDWAQDRLVPDMMRSFAAGIPVVLRNPRAARPWQYVLDALRGYLLLAEQLFEDGAHFSGGWNFGPAAGGIRSVQWIAETLATAWGTEAEWKIAPDSLPVEGQMLRLDTSKAEAKLGWKPVFDLAESLQRTVAWYRDLYDGQNMIETYRRQIAEYSARMDTVNRHTKRIGLL